MSLKSTDIEDYYGDAYLRRWVWKNGQPRCVEDAFLVADITGAEVTAQEAANAAVRSLLADVEAYEAAVDLLNRYDEAPPATITVVGADGNETTETNPERTAYDAAQVTIEGASDDILAVLLLRQGEPEKFDEDGQTTMAWTAWDAARTRIGDVG